METYEDLVHPKVQDHLNALPREDLIKLIYLLIATIGEHHRTLSGIYPCKRCGRPADSKVS